MIGAVLGGRYEILRRLGEGGMGVVYEARQIDTGRRSALKIITGDLAGNPGVVQRFELEARAAAAVDSEHIVQVLESGYDAAHRAPFLAMELLAGTDVQVLIERGGPLPPELVLRIGAQACLGLEKAHARGIIHRDIKPANLFLAEGVGDEIRVKILDFGIAKMKLEDPSQASRPKLTRTGTLLGSPLYMSPEQARSPRYVDHRSDLWSLGVVLYEALTGAAPLAELTDLGEIILSLCVEPPMPLARRAPWVDPAIARIVEQALVINPEARYPSARAMLDAIAAQLPGGLAGVGLRAPMLSFPRRGASEQSPSFAADLGTANTLAAAPRVHATVVGEPMHAMSSPPVAPPPPPPATSPTPRRASHAPLLGLVALLAAASGLGVTYALGWIGPPRGANATPIQAAPPPLTTLSPAPGPALPESLAALRGAWKSESGRIYDAVPNGEALELQIRDVGTLAERGYLEREARFTLRAIAGDPGTFQVEDSIRPIPPKGLSYDPERSRATCVQSWSSIGNKPLTAQKKGEKLVVQMTTVEVPTSLFLHEGNRVVGCSPLGGARVSGVESVLTKL
jgi:serine/threonine-protein kinase